jgi:hypothetical protein
MYTISSARVAVFPNGRDWFRARLLFCRPRTILAALSFGARGRVSDPNFQVPLAPHAGTQVELTRNMVLPVDPIHILDHPDLPSARQSGARRNQRQRRPGRTPSVDSTAQNSTREGGLRGSLRGPLYRTGRVSEDISAHAPVRFTASTAAPKPRRTAARGTVAVQQSQC